ncbi:MAG: nucleotidyltransferase family protein, partial [Bacteroidaceae bacterium]|nr:nucleotidyltransferase family protein [Bacteroidaceae bacterium]
MQQGTKIEERFFQLIQVAVGKKVDAMFDLVDDEWLSIYKMASEQSILGLVLQAADILSGKGLKPPMSLLYQWIGEGEQIRQQNHRVDQQCEQLSSWFKQKELSSCVIKGQGVARLYPQPDLRQPGDIDIWVDGKRDEIV